MIEYIAIFKKIRDITIISAGGLILVILVINRVSYEIKKDGKGGLYWKKFPGNKERLPMSF